ncbi:hypothetical protein MMC30_002710 [Trapelia coarctata]|nr:hypothetical protein [Trapelia coarctata]
MHTLPAVLVAEDTKAASMLLLTMDLGIAGRKARSGAPLIRQEEDFKPRNNTILEGHSFRADDRLLATGSGDHTSQIIGSAITKDGSTSSRRTSLEDYSSNPSYALTITTSLYEHSAWFVASRRSDYFNISAGSPEEALWKRGSIFEIDNPDGKAEKLEVLEMMIGPRQDEYDDHRQHLIEQLDEAAAMKQYCGGADRDGLAWFVTTPTATWPRQTTYNA